MPIKFQTPEEKFAIVQKQLFELIKEAVGENPEVSMEILAKKIMQKWQDRPALSDQINLLAVKAKGENKVKCTIGFNKREWNMIISLRPE